MCLEGSEKKTNLLRGTWVVSVSSKKSICGWHWPQMWTFTNDWVEKVVRLLPELSVFEHFPGRTTQFGCGCARLRGREGSEGVNSLFRPCVRNFKDGCPLCRHSVLCSAAAHQHRDLPTRFCIGQWCMKGASRKGTRGAEHTPCV